MSNKSGYCMALKPEPLKEVFGDCLAGSPLDSDPRPDVARTRSPCSGLLPRWPVFVSTFAVSNLVPKPFCNCCIFMRDLKSGAFRINLRSLMGLM